MTDQIEKVWGMMEKIGFCMLATREGEEMHTRPMAAYIDRDEKHVYFLTDRDSHKDEDIARDPHVNLAFADNSAMRYVSLSGRAAISNDRQKIRDLWGTPAKAWWDDPEDPSIRVLKVTPVTAHYWDAPNKMMAYAKMAAAAVSDTKPEMGDQGVIRF